jgi:ribosomal protein S18 acetylase RimI-like enzyme
MSGMEVSLREAAEGDAEFLFGLHRVSLGAVIEATWGPWEDAQQREFHRAWFDPARLLVVVCGGQDIGVVDAHHRADGVVYLARIELLPQFQGLRIGTRLIEQLAARARDAGAAAIELDVLEANEGARRLYERLGFSVTGETSPKLGMRLALMRS